MNAFLNDSQDHGISPETQAAINSHVADTPRTVRTSKLPQGLATPTPPMGTHVRQSSRADFRVNLVVNESDVRACKNAGGVYDATNQVMYAPPRTNLRPLAAWLPFDLDCIDSDPKTGVIMDSADVPKAAGPVKQDGSPNMSFTANRRMRVGMDDIESFKGRVVDPGTNQSAR